MKFERSIIIKLAVIAALLVIAPYVVPFAFELVLLADFMGLEALVLFLIYQSRDALFALSRKWAELIETVGATIVLLGGLYMMQPKVLASHVAGSSLILFFACSLVVAMALWIPAIYLSAGGFV